MDNTTFAIVDEIAYVIIFKDIFVPLNICSLYLSTSSLDLDGHYLK